MEVGNNLSEEQVRCGMDAELRASFRGLYI
jgi:hypothetical protein